MPWLTNNDVGDLTSEAGVLSTEGEIGCEVTLSDGVPVFVQSIEVEVEGVPNETLVDLSSVSNNDVGDVTSASRGRGRPQRDIG